LSARPRPAIKAFLIYTPVTTLGWLDNGSSVEITATLPGDASLDGAVDINDLTIVPANYNATSGAVWSQGDFTCDGRVDSDDLTIVLANCNQTLGASAPALASPLFSPTCAAAWHKQCRGPRLRSTLLVPSSGTLLPTSPVR
jgi:hypothetical protein